ncbi:MULTISPECIES: OsmC family protein [Streptosporangium]|uniref:Organic hydroperoxide reductase OsmC/OhrA n=1 Tax=Streptosporangium brasiliense TaxID=47480 RepID=A0ABT9RFM9_9ACTN|nr:OsmC family protein [Streptosporangium brasiliense]MDP9867652.1 organic hydroperoxide reductase OsmC/OhrA [Streptosporangium brasiliense]
MPKIHHYEVDVTWTGNGGTGTSDYRAYGRAHEIGATGKAPIAGSSDPSFRGERDRWNPEELLVVSLSQCHMLWYLGLCANAGVVVTAYTDHPSGTMAEAPDGSGRFEEVVLRPRVTVAAPEHAERAAALHERAHEMCFIANSVNFPVRHEPVVVSEPLPV